MPLKLGKAIFVLNDNRMNSAIWARVSATLIGTICMYFTRSYIGNRAIAIRDLLVAE